MTDICLCCDQPFTPFRTHPAVEASWCDACRRVLVPLWFELVTTRRAPITRPEEV